MYIRKLCIQWILKFQGQKGMNRCLVRLVGGGAYMVRSWFERESTQRVKT